MFNFGFLSRMKSILRIRQSAFPWHFKTMWTITFSRFDEHSIASPLFKSLEIIKFLDLVTFYLAIIMYIQINYHNQLLPPVFSSFFNKITIIQGLQSYVISQKHKQIMEYSILDFKVHQYGIPSMKILNHLLCLYLKSKWNSTLSKIIETSVHRFCNSKIRNNTVLQCKNFSHFNILGVYLTLFISIFLCTYASLFLCPWP